jgi:aquaporin related protein
MQSSIQSARVEQHPSFGNHEVSKRRARWNAIKNHLLAASSEFLGTVLFLWFAFAGTQVAAMSTEGTGGPNDEINDMDPQRLLYISLSFGMSLLVVAWAFYRISGGLFNPAVSYHGSLHKYMC